MLLRTVALSLMVLAVPAAATELKLKPYTLTYAIIDNKKEIGEAKVQLKAITDKRFEYTSNSAGTSGLAALLGGKIDEKTELEWTGTMLRPVAFTYAQQFALRTRTQNGRFDWIQKKASGENKDKPWTQPLKRRTVNRQLVDLTVAEAIANGEDDIGFDVIDRGDIRSWRFKRDGEEEITTRAGSFQAIRVLRIRESADGRETKMWFAPSLGYVPIRVEHTEKDGRGLSLDLKIKPKF